MESFLDGASTGRVFSFAAIIGPLILLTAVTDTEHHPAAGIAFGMASREWDPEIFGGILGVVLVLEAFKFCCAVTSTT